MFTGAFQIVPDGINRNAHPGDDIGNIVQAVGAVLGVAIREDEEHHLGVGDFLGGFAEHIQANEYGIVSGGAAVGNHMVDSTGEEGALLVVEALDLEIHKDAIAIRDEADVIVAADILRSGE